MCDGLPTTVFVSVLLIERPKDMFTPSEGTVLEHKRFTEFLERILVLIEQDHKIRTGPVPFQRNPWKDQSAEDFSVCLISAGNKVISHYLKNVLQNLYEERKHIYHIPSISIGEQELGETVH